VKDINSKLYLSNKILVCKAATYEATLYVVKSWEILTDKELCNLGTTWNHRTNRYVAFHLENGKEIKTPDMLSPISYRYSTLEGLNRYLTDPISNKGYFYITNPDAARLYKELTKQNIQFQVKWADDKLDPSLIKFVINDTVIFSSDKLDVLHFSHNNESVSLQSIIQLAYNQE
jgi:hypothetical protein